MTLVSSYISRRKPKEEQDDDRDQQEDKCSAQLVAGDLPLSSPPAQEHHKGQQDTGIILHLVMPNKHKEEVVVGVMLSSPTCYW